MDAASIGGGVVHQFAWGDLAVFGSTREDGRSSVTLFAEAIPGRATKVVPAYVEELLAD
jgi:hypothetical protein